MSHGHRPHQNSLSLSQISHQPTQFGMGTQSQSPSQPQSAAQTQYLAYQQQARVPVQQDARHHAMSHPHQPNRIQLHSQAQTFSQQMHNNVQSPVVSASNAIGSASASIGLQPLHMLAGSSGVANNAHSTGHLQTLHSDGRIPEVSGQSSDPMDDSSITQQGRKVRGRGRQRGRGRGRGKGRGHMSTELTSAAIAESTTMDDDDAAPLLIAAAAAAAAAAVAEPAKSNEQANTSTDVPEGAKNKSFSKDKKIVNEQPLVSMDSKAPGTGESKNELQKGRNVSDDDKKNVGQDDTGASNETKGEEMENGVAGTSGSGDEKNEEIGALRGRGRGRGRRGRPRGRGRGRGRARVSSRTSDTLPTTRSRKRGRRSGSQYSDAEADDDERGDEKRLRNADGKDESSDNESEQKLEEDDMEEDRESKQDNEHEDEKVSQSDEDMEEEKADEDEDEEDDDRDDENDDDYKQPVESGNENSDQNTGRLRRSRRASALAGSAKIAEVSNVDRRGSRTRLRSGTSNVKTIEKEGSSRKRGFSKEMGTRRSKAQERDEDDGDISKGESDGVNNSKMNGERANSEMESSDSDDANEGANSTVDDENELSVDKVKMEVMRLDLERRRVDMEIQRLELEKKRLDMKEAEQKFRYDFLQKQREIEVERLEMERRRSVKEDEDRQAAQRERQALNSLLTALLQRLGAN